MLRVLDTHKLLLFLTVPHTIKCYFLCDTVDVTNYKVYQPQVPSSNTAGNFIVMKSGKIQPPPPPLKK